MNTKGNKFISLVDLGMAYRKAKADLFYSQLARKKALSVFESNLTAHLKALQRSLHDDKSSSFLNDAWTLVPKKYCKLGDRLFDVLLL